MPESPDPACWLRHAVVLAVDNVNSGAGGPFGALIVRGGEPLAEGVNRVTASYDPTAHAEISDIRNAGRELKTHDLAGCEIYTSCEPCPMCLGAILWARLDRVWFAATQQQAAAAGFDDSLFYQQMALPAGGRLIPMIAGLVEESEKPFLAWRKFSAKVPY